MLTIEPYAHEVGIRRMRIGAGTWIVAGLVAVALVCVVTGFLPRADAGALGARIAPVLGFVVAITIVAELARDAAVFDVVSQRLARWGRGRVLALWALVVALAVVSTVFLSLDTTAVIVTPVVVVLAQSIGVSPLPFALATVWLANTASLALPVSNLTNLFAAPRSATGRGHSSLSAGRPRWSASSFPSRSSRSCIGVPSSVRTRRRCRADPPIRRCSGAPPASSSC
ncbi:hypothetical protein GCM10010213_32090 [Microbacterium maritypicum]|uniref:Citrate transporter-like domain-containing protein n=1 Tax=Microbacterium maritypicum TaxID=33918 RepID=A0A4Y4BD76_MICMQ|nr:hypothetical protein MLI01_31890 [Microbacterium liquefaciens]GGV66033.1 hypothetical protein GCM10010213_32090 [Microbacterium liquefaciens]